MLSDNDTAHAYAHLMEAVEDWGKLLNGLYDSFLPEERPLLRSMGSMRTHLNKALKMLEP